MSFRPSDGTGHFLDQIGRIPLLTAAEEIHLGQTVRTWLDDPEPSRALIRRGRRAKDRMVSANLRLVVMVAKKYTSRAAELGLSLDDLIQSGTLGLVRGAEKFDPEKGYKFSTYSYWWIRQAIVRDISQMGGPIRIPVHIGDALNKVRHATARLVREGIAHPSKEQLVEATGKNLSEITLALDYGIPARAVRSLDAQLKNDRDDGCSLLETIATDGDEAAKLLHEGELQELIADLQARCADELALVQLKEADGFLNKDIGELLGCSRASATYQVQQARHSLRAAAGVRGQELLELAA